jgi:hypothetical protein
MRSPRLVLALALVTLCAAACGGGSSNVQEDAGPPDETAPVVTLDLGRYAVVQSTQQVTHLATDDVAVVRAELLVDDVVVGQSAAEPFSVDWDTTGAADGVHTIQVAAYDAAGNRGASDPTPVFVLNAGTDVTLDEDLDGLAGLFTGTFSVPASWSGNAEQIDKKYHWTMPAGISRVMAVILFDPTAGFALDYATGTGWCPDQGGSKLNLAESDGEILLDYAPGGTLTEGQWFVHVGATNAADMKGQSVDFQLRVVLLP